MESFIIDKYERYTYPFAVIILTIIGVIVSARKSREGIGMQIVLGIILAFIYFIMSIGTIIISNANLKLLGTLSIVITCLSSFLPGP